VKALAILLGLLLAGTAAAAPPAAKLARLEQKRAAKRPSAAERARADKRLAKRIGKKPAAIVNLRNIWTSETLPVEASAKAEVDQATFDRFMRCHFTNQSTSMDLRLFGVLVGAALHFKADRVDIVSGYRAPKYNLRLRKHGHEVARNSQHTFGTATDFTIPGVKTRALVDYVRGLQVGGAGFYPESGFVHADTGKVRTWAGQ
jgi:uncharacterized protein YcbK (DUF882 family)